MRKTKKPTRAQQEAQASYEALMRKWANVPKFAKTPVKGVKSSAVPKPAIRETPKYESVDTGFNSCTKPVHGLRYTGSNLLGIGVMHKSNSVPVFNSDQAVEIARMRRG